MEMESTRRPFDRSRELGLKKARLAQPDEPINPKNSISNKFQVTNDREIDLESVDSGRGSYSQQQQIQELVVQYREALAELTFNSKPIITNLTIIAGENLHAAKAITATVCANILEVPSDQKLPSLYLLDSIVKNIGRDYIKYFGARLPEVFCKAYRQVDPSTHPGMRHLFGTWKGVFPPQPLQMIEKELAFLPAANGSSSGSATSRSESQSQRPATSIHVNPKYLEARQRLQQPNRTKGLTEASSVTMVNSIQDAGRLDRAVGMSSGRQWPEPNLKTQSTQRQRNAPEELVRQKNIVAAYGSYDHDSDHSSQSGLEIGVERLIDKPWYGANNNLEEKTSICRNGLDIKQVPSYVTPNAGKTIVPLLPKKSISGKSSIAIDESWKSSDEEEFMWDDLNSKSSDQYSLGVSQRHRWTPDEPNRTGLENDPWRPQGLHEMGSKINREASAERKDQAHFRNQRSPSWTEEQHLTDETIYSVSDRGRLGHPEGFTNPLSGVSMPANSLTKAPILPHMSPSHIGTTIFGFSTNQELVPPVSVRQKRSFVPDSLAEQDYRQSQLPRRSEITKSQFSGTQNMVSHLSRDTLPLQPQDTLVANSPKFPPKNLQTSTSVVHSAPPRHHIPVAEPSRKVNLPALAKTRAPENIPSTRKSLLNQSGKNSAVDSIMKNEMRGNKTGTIKSQSPSACNPPPPSGPASKAMPMDSRLTVSKSETSQAKLSAATALSQIKAEQQPLPPGIPPSSLASGSASDPVSSLLSTLVAKGLITASKSEPPTSSTQQISTSSSNVKPSAINSSPVPVSSVTVKPNKKVSTDTTEPPISTEKCSIEEAKPLIGLEFKPDLIRQSHPSVIEGLLHDLPHQCDLCGLQLKLQERLERHLEWHASRKPEDSFQNSRRWYTNQENWGAGKDMTCSEERTRDELDEGEVMVLADESQCVCVLCGEIFEDVYCLKTDEWMFKGAVYLSVPLGESEIGTLTGSASKGPIVHANCISENSLKDLGFPEA